MTIFKVKNKGERNCPNRELIIYSLLTQIDIERWRFVLYKSPDERWIGDFSYSPKSFVD